MQNEILIDSGPLIALFDRDDSYHDRVVEFIRDKRYRFVTTLAVVTEVSHMLDFSIQAQIDFLEWIAREGLILYDIGVRDMTEIIELVGKYQDMPMDFADASLVITAKRLGIRKIISIDSDFDVYRLPGKERVENVFHGF